MRSSRTAALTAAHMGNTDARVGSESWARAAEGHVYDGAAIAFPPIGAANLFSVLVIRGSATDDVRQKSLTGILLLSRAFRPAGQITNTTPKTR